MTRSGCGKERTTPLPEFNPVIVMKPFNFFSLMLMLLLTQIAQAQSTALGYQALPYPAPKPATYQLPSMGPAANGQVLASDGKALNLKDLYGDKLVVLSFIYATCDDVNGCPLATVVLRKLKAKLMEKPELTNKLRLITLSFDPHHDTPSAMAHYAEGFQGAGVEWRFLTTAGEAQIQPILKAFGQEVEQEHDAQGHASGKYSHLLRVFLIDLKGQIRNVYTISTLHPDLLLADVETLSQEKPGQPAQAQVLPNKQALLRPGDDKTGYESSRYQTHSVALTQRQGKTADLLTLAQNPGLGLPSLPVPADNPLSREKIELGRKLFFDRRLSLNNTFSCAMCHIPEQGYTSQEQATAVGVEGRSVRRNSPTLYNVGYAEKLFHDGRESSLENQVWGPLLAHNEMANPSVGFVLNKLKSLPDYQDSFEQAFGRGPSMETLGQAIASYERTLNSATSPFDRWYYGKQEKAIDESAQRGFALFTGKAGCSQCHSVGEKSALFSDNQLHNTGLGYLESMRKEPPKQKVQVAPGISMEIDRAAVTSVSGEKANDLGLYEISQNPVDRWKYKTPTLRNIALTAPYMHNGRFTSLREVLDFYNRGGEPNENLDLRIKPLHLNSKEIEDLFAFLNSLTGDNVETLVLDAYAAPVGNSQ